MARLKIPVDYSELQQAIDEVEANGLYTSPHKVYEAVAQSEWGQKLGLTSAVVYLRVREANHDPNNPRIVVRTKPARVKSTTPRAKSARSSKATFTGLELLVSAFHDRGVEVADVGDLMTSAHKSREVNKAILMAWADLRGIMGCPRPLKSGEVLPVEAPASLNGQPIEVIEEWPDGGAVQSGPSIAPPIASASVIENDAITEEWGTPVAVPLPLAVGLAVPIPIGVPQVAYGIPIEVFSWGAPVAEEPWQDQSLVDVEDNGFPLPVKPVDWVGNFYCESCEFRCSTTEGADQHEAENPGHLVNV